MPKTILLADDSVTIQKVVGISFANEDVVLLTVDNGDDAVTQARESRPDIVLADIVMPGKSGYEVCEALRGDPSLQNIPVLLLSGTFETFDDDRAREVGANGHITKPFEAQSLVDRVNELLEAGPLTNAPAAEPLAPTMGTSFADPSPSQSGSEAYDFFDEEIPAMSSEPAQMAETKLIGGDAAGDSVSGQVFDLEPMEDGGARHAAPAVEAVAAERPERDLGADWDSDSDSDGGFGESFAPEEPVAMSSAFSFEENPDLAEAVEAFAHPDSLGAPPRPEPDPLTTPVPGPAVPKIEDPEADGVPDDVLARGVSQTFEATEVHPPDFGPAAGDDLYDDFGGSSENELFADSADDAAPFAEEPAVAAELPARPAVQAAAAAEAAPMGWDEDPESLSQSALEPLPEFSSEPEAEVMVESHEAPAPTSIPVEAPASPDPVSNVASQPVDESPVAPQLPMELQERMHATLERVAWEAMGDLSERVIKETLSRIESIAWEVIPQMAETMIREELDRIAKTDDDE